MTQYLITKREPCDCATNISEGRFFISSGDGWICAACSGTGFIDTPVDLLEVLAKVKWGETTTKEYLDGFHEAQRVRQFDNVRIEE